MKDHFDALFDKFDQGRHDADLMAKKFAALPPQCNCTDRIAPCDGVLAGGMCDNIQDDPEDENGCFFCSRRQCRGECEGL